MFVLDEPPLSSTRDRRDMSLTLAYSANAYRRYPLEEAIQRIAALSYAGVGLMADAPPLWPAEVSERRAKTWTWLRASAPAPRRDSLEERPQGLDRRRGLV